MCCFSSIQQGTLVEWLTDHDMLKATFSFKEMCLAKICSYMPFFKGFEEKRKFLSKALSFCLDKIIFLQGKIKTILVNYSVSIVMKRRLWTLHTTKILSLKRVQVKKKSKMTSKNTKQPSYNEKLLQIIYFYPKNPCFKISCHIPLN